MRSIIPRMSYATVRYQNIEICKGKCKRVLEEGGWRDWRENTIDKEREKERERKRERAQEKEREKERERAGGNELVPWLRVGVRTQAREYASEIFA